MTIHLTPEIENALAQEARRQGTTAELLALECLRQRFAPAVAEPRTLADFLAGHVGVLASGELVPGGARMSEGTGSKFAAGLAQKRQQGRL